jgi:[ribosomal protein S18]-alanine N-acetyltransferase
MMLQAGTAHAGILATLHRACFSAPWHTTEFAALLAQPGVAAWIATEDAIPVAFILVRAAADEAEILTLAVLPDHRRKGLAAHLMQTASTQLRTGGTRRIFLEVAADNVPAATLYECHGFAPCGRRPDYYSNRTGPMIDAVVMRKLL